VEGEMITTLRREQKESTFHYPKSDRVEWVFNNLGLMVNTGAQVWWTYEVGDVFGKVRKGDQMP
jgi:dynein heavy chain